MSDTPEATPVAPVLPPSPPAKAPNKVAAFIKDLVVKAIAYEEANSRKIAATLTTLTVKSIYGKALIAAALAFLGVQNGP